MLRRAPLRRKTASRARLVAGAACSLLLLGFGACEVEIVSGVPSRQGEVPVRITLPVSADPASATVFLDGEDVTGAFFPRGRGLVGSLPVGEPGRHRVEVVRPFEFVPGLSVALRVSKRLAGPAPAPHLIGVDPVDAGGRVPRTAWLRFRFAAPLPADAIAGWGFGIACDGQAIPRAAYPLGRALILNPEPELPAGAHCRVVWRAQDGGIAEIAFDVAPDAGGEAATVLYDRGDPVRLAPFPDDFWVVPDASTATGVVVDFPAPPFTEGLQHQAFQALASEASGLDGWSRQTPIVVAFSHPLDPSAVPPDALAAMDPFAAIALVDVDPQSPEFGRRIPYHLMLRSDPVRDGSDDHVALIFPGIDLRERGEYALIVSRRAFAAGMPGRPFGPSPFFARASGAPQPDDPEPVVRARTSIAAALDSVARLPQVPIPAEDVALALRLSIRTQPAVDDLVHIKEQALASPPPQLILPDPDVDPCPDPEAFCLRVTPSRALEARGRVVLPNYRGPVQVFARDPATGQPLPTGSSEVPFVLTLPEQALDGPVHPIMYQHGNPGSPREILSESRNGQLDDAGFALVGMQDTLNREIGNDVAVQVQAIFFLLVAAQHLPDYWNQTGADMIYFLRAIQGMAGLDLIHRGPDGEPELGPDGIHEIDPSVILYKGISEGANNAQRFLPFAPEILAAAPTVGGARLSETLIHQSSDEILSQIGAVLPQLRPVDLWVGLALFQAAFDPQDGHTFLRYLYDQPLLPFAGSDDTTPPSTLWTEGVGDSLVPNNASRAMATELNLPHVGPVAAVVPTLQVVPAPLVENLGPGLTAGYFQIDPTTTPSCLAMDQPEAHYCAQASTEGQAQRLHFYETALQGAPEIVDPFE
jgi:hypothetical protein